MIYLGFIYGFQTNFYRELQIKQILNALKSVHKLWQNLFRLPWIIVTLKRIKNLKKEMATLKYDNVSIWMFHLQSCSRYICFRFWGTCWRGWRHQFHRMYYYQSANMHACLNVTTDGRPLYNRKCGNQLVGIIKCRWGLWGGFNITLWKFTLWRQMINWTLDWGTNNVYIVCMQACVEWPP